MRINSKNQCAILMALCVSVILFSCNDDKDSDSFPDNALSNVGVLDKDLGLRVKSVGDYNYIYHDDGKLLSIKNYLGHYDFTYKPNKVSYVREDGRETSNYSIKYNAKGYISSVSYDRTIASIEYKSQSKGTSSFTYDKEGHMVKINDSYKYIEDDTDQKWTDGTTTTTFTWENSLLKKIVSVVKGSNDNGSSQIVQTTTFEYNNSSIDSYHNKYLQYGYFASDLFNGLLEPMCYVGLVGYGPEILPSGIKIEWNEEYYSPEGEKESYYDKDSYSYSYTFNSYGAILDTYIDADSYSFTYDAINSANANNSQSYVSKAVNTKSDTRSRHIKGALHGGIIKM